tara:strand:- start:1039 stop:1242 length:204 start_codon:yes stop_codon:yes gene_type:complete
MNKFVKNQSPEETAGEEKYNWMMEEQRAEMMNDARESSEEVELYDGQPVMHLPNELYMVFDDPDYWG